MYKISVVEDDPVISSLLCKNLQKWGYETHCVTDFQNVAQCVLLAQPHLVLMDILLPYFNGFYWCAEVRRHSDVPVVFLSSASDNMNIVMAMNMGGDDFITKPFDPDVLIAKLRAVLRRVYSPAEQNLMLQCGDMLLNLADQSLSCGGQRLELTRNELRILRLLLENRGSIVSRERIIEALWESEDFIDDNTLTVNINRLRGKLRQVGLDELIKTRKGAGYLVE
ncbi:MAG: response regulator transcription factor [Clostridia bacterium]|nr:response regulator transcription factor [Clostridia bacterium]